MSRREAPVLNARIRKRWTAGKFPVAYVGPRGLDLTYPAEHLGDGMGALDGAAFMDALKAAQKPMVILGRGALQRADGAAVLAAAWQLAADIGALTPDWHGFNVLHLFGGQVGALELGFVPGQGGKDVATMLAGGVDALWLLNADGFDPARIAAGTFVVYQGHHGDAMAATRRCDPAGRRVHREGRDLGEHRGSRAAWAPRDLPARRGARKTGASSAPSAKASDKTLPYDDTATIRAALAASSAVFAQVGEVARGGCTDPSGPAASGAVSGGAVRPAAAGLSPGGCDQPCLGRDGRMRRDLRAGPGPGGGVT